MSNVTPKIMQKQILVHESDLEELTNMLQAASDVVSQLSVLFRTVSQKAERRSDADNLSKIGQHVCDDWSNVFETDKERFIEKFQNVRAAA